MSERTLEEELLWKLDSNSRIVGNADTDYRLSVLKCCYGRKRECGSERIWPNRVFGRFASPGDSFCPHWDYANYACRAELEYGGYAYEFINLAVDMQRAGLRAHPQQGRRA